MPQPVELRVRGGERRRMAVAEPDDRDPREQVEVAVPRVVGQPGALAVDERDRQPCVGRQQVLLGDRVHATTAVAPISAVMPLAAAIAAARSFGTIPPSNAPSSSSRLASIARIASTTTSSR